MTQEELNEILKLNKAWANGEPGGKRANLTGADLRYVNLRGVNLRDADLSYADLRDADLRDADLTGVDLRYVNLRGADLTGVDLRYVNLRGVNLRDADLSYADLRDADLRDADLSYVDLRYVNLRGVNLRGVNLRDADLSYVNLRGVNLCGADLTGASVPLVENLHQKIAAAVGGDGENLDMDRWHCGTIHCRAGWAIVFAGEAGAKLEQEVGSNVAGALIYLKSTGMVPDFYTSNEDALEDIKRCAELEVKA